MKKTTTLMVTAAICVLLASITANATVIDAPHNATNNIMCSDCHTYSMWWNSSPTGAGDAGYGAITDNVCFSCHDDVKAPAKQPHSWLSMDDMHNPQTGEWFTNCIDCHDPHYQAQVDWIATDEPSLFLVTGEIVAGSLLYDATNHETTIAYQGAAAKAEWADASLWSAKTVTDRGLILLTDQVTADSSFEVNMADATTPIILGDSVGAGSITVQGEIPAGYDGSTFALIYGQLVRNSIHTPAGVDRDVKFFNGQDPAGGFTSAGLTPTGVCQVCHTKTSYWLANGLASDHNAGTDCASCHAQDLGFKPEFPSHDLLGVCYNGFADESSASAEICL